MDGLKIFVEKLSQYNFLTNILPGTILCMILTYCVGYNFLISDNWYLQGVVFYFIGIVNNRFGSLVIENLLKKLNVIKFTPYEDFVQAEIKDSKIAVLSTDNNTFRSCVSLCILSIIALLFKVLESNCTLIANCDCKYKTLVLMILILVLFVFSYHKQTAYVNKRGNQSIKKE